MNRIHRFCIGSQKSEMVGMACVCVGVGVWVAYGKKLTRRERLWIVCFGSRSLEIYIVCVRGAKQKNKKQKEQKRKKR